MPKRSPLSCLNAALLRCGVAGVWLAAAAGTVARADLQAPKSSGKVPPLPSTTAPAAKSTALASNTATSSRATAAMTPSAPAAAISSTANLPRVVIPTSNRPTAPVRPVQPGAGILYPWRQNITATVFWIGEAPSQNNPTPNYKSSWDQAWASNYGGYDNPDPSARLADLQSGEFRPKGFTPRLNPFYIALPYNDVESSSRTKAEASKVIPWFARMNPDPGKTVCKSRWLQIYYGGKSCYAQWEDCGPWNTDDWQYVFQGKPPKNTNNQSAAIDISPSVRDYLGLQSGQKCHWRFVEDAQVPYGPWKKYGATAPAEDPNLDAQRKYLQYLSRLRDEQYQGKTASQLQGH